MRIVRFLISVWKLINRIVVLVAAPLLLADFFAPPLIDFQARDWRTDGQGISAQMSAFDVRGCHYVPSRATGLIYADDQWWTAPLTIAGVRDAQTTPLRWRELGRWTWGKSDGHVDVKRLTATLFVVCAGALQSINVGPFDAPS